MNLSFAKLFSNTLILTIGQAGGQALSLLRNAIFGHFLSPEDFGVAAIFTITISAVEMASDMGADKLLIQSKEGNEKNFQNTVHFYMFLRGLIGGAILYFISPYIATSFKIPDNSDAFLILAWVVFIRGFIHLDIKRLQRQFIFFPFVITEIFPQFIAVLIAFPLVQHFDNYQAVAYVIIVHALFYVLISHSYAKRRYRLQINIDYLKKLFSFGWPLILNGFLMYFIFQGDKLFVGKYFDLTTLGIYSAAFMITMVPAQMIVKIMISLKLPVFSKFQDDIFKLNYTYLVGTEAALYIAFFFSTFFMFFGNYVLVLVFGNQYTGIAILVSILSFMWSLRIIRVPSTLFAMAKGNTRISLAGNILRSFALLGVYLLSIKQAPIEQIALCGCAGEILAILYSTVAIKRFYQASLLPFLVRFCLFITFSGLLFYSAYGLTFTKQQQDITNVSILLTALIIFFFSLLFKTLRNKGQIFIKG